jgi:hypothetical protein
MKFQLLHRAVKGPPVVSLNTVTRVVHIRLVSKQIHNARILPTAAATCPVLTVKFRQPSHEFTFGVGMSFIPYPLVLTPVV